MKFEDNFVINQISSQLAMFTVLERNSETIEVMKSKFIAVLLPLDNDEIVKQIIKDFKKEHKKAKHVVYAYRVGNKYKSNDDGEPSGTAGRPLLELLMKKDLNNVLLVVIRYFGGTLLGASRLLRTYVSSGVSVINKAKLVEM